MRDLATIIAVNAWVSSGPNQSTHDFSRIIRVLHPVSAREHLHRNLERRCGLLERALKPFDLEKLARTR
jgi:hypothetical protein